MLKKIVPLFIFISMMFIFPVYADRQFQFELKKDVENQQIIYTWENKVEDISFEMVSPSKKVFNENTYDLIDYNLEKNKITIRFDKMEKGIWKVFFRGDTDIVGVKNSITEYYPIPEEDIKENLEEEISKIDKVETSEKVISEISENPEIIIIGGEQEKIEEKTENIEGITEIVEDIEKLEDAQQVEEIKVEVFEESEIVLTEEELKIIEEKENLAKERLEERELAKENKKQQKVEEQLALEEAKREEQLKESEEEIVFIESQPVEEEIIEEENKEQVIILGNEEDTSVQKIEIQQSEQEVNLININADEERAKIQQQIEKENTKILINKIIMVIPFITVTILFVVNLILKKKSKQKRVIN